MRSILEAFANDEILTGARFVKNGSEYSKQMEKLCDTENKLLGTLNTNEQELLKEYSHIQSEINELSGTDRFLHGYRLGVLMTTEVFTTSDDLVISGEA